MKRFSTVSNLIFLLLLFLFSPPSYSTDVSGTISVDTDWTLAGSPYIVTGSITVNSGVTLTIYPGVEVRFKNYTGLTVNGALVAVGSEANRITFTSNQATPGPGDWRFISFTNTCDDEACILNYCIIQYGGYNNTQNIVLNNASPTISNCEISYSLKYGIVCVYNSFPTISGNTIANNAYYGIYCHNGASPTITNNIFTDNAREAVYFFDCPVINTITGNSGSGNGYNGIYINGTLNNNGTLTTGNINFPYIVGSITINNGVSLTIEAPNVIKMVYQILVNGSLIADGADGSEIVFTSIKDDSYGGDTNNDGNSTSPSPGDWRFISFTNTCDDEACILDYCIIQYGGYNNTQNIVLNNASPTISNCEISYSFKYGIVVSNNSSPSITGNTITNNYYGIYCQNGASPKITVNVISYNERGIGSTNANPIINYNNIENNTSYGVHNSTPSIIINAQYNWWGDMSGPLDDSDDRATGGWYNPGGLGDKVSNYVDYQFVGCQPCDDAYIPVELTSFTAAYTDDAVTLTWTTATEAENLGYYIYRSTNGENEYRQITQQIIQGAGTTYEPQLYTYIDSNIEAGNTYSYKLAEVAFDGTITFHGPLSVTIEVFPANYVLEQNYPNPFNPTTTINFSLKADGLASLKIYDLRGRLVLTLIDEYKEAGSYSLIWNGVDQKGIPVASGMYLYTLRVNGFEETKKLVFMK